MRKLLLASAIAAIPFVAQADPIFNIGSTFTVTGTNAPGSFSDIATLNNLPQSLDGGALSLTTSIVPTGGGGEWIVFDYHSTDGPLGTAALNWALSEIGVQTNVATNFDQSFASFDINGTNETPTSSVFPGFSVVANPVPGGIGFGLGASGFTAPFPAGPLSSLGSFIDPWGQLDSHGINSTTTTSYEEALHFTPQEVIPPPGVPEPSTIALLGFGLLGTLAAARRSKRR